MRHTAFIFLILLLLLPVFTYAVVEPYKPYLHKAQVPDHPKLATSGTAKVELFTGAEQFSYPIIVPQGTNGLQPSLSIVYESHTVADQPTLLATGW